MVYSESRSISMRKTIWNWYNKQYYIYNRAVHTLALSDDLTGIIQNSMPKASKHKIMGNTIAPT